MPTRGFTLVELMFTLVVVAILLGAAVPSIHKTILVNRLHHAAEDFRQFLLEAKSVAIQKNQPVYLNYGAWSSTEHCVGYRAGLTCYCTTAGSCDKVFTDRDYDGVSFYAGNGSSGVAAFQPYGWAPGKWTFKMQVGSNGTYERRAWIVTNKMGVINLIYTDAY